MKGTQTISMVKVKVQFSGEILNSEMPHIPWLHVSNAECEGEKGRVVRTYHNERRGQEDHARAGEDADIVTLVDRPPALPDGRSAEELIPEILNLLPRPLIPLQHLSQLTDSLLQLSSHRPHLLSVRRPLR